MIVNFILNLIYNLAIFFLDLLPEVSMPDGILNAITTAGSYVSAMNIILPMDTLMAIIGLFLTIEGVILVIKIINWVIRKIPTIN